MSGGNSKREKVDAFVRRAAMDALAEAAISNPNSAEWLRANRSYLCAEICRRIVWDDYRMQELQDIMDWKKPLKVRE